MSIKIYYKYINIKMSIKIYYKYISIKISIKICYYKHIKMSVKINYYKHIKMGGENLPNEAVSSAGAEICPSLIFLLISIDLTFAYFPFEYSNINKFNNNFLSKILFSSNSGGMGPNRLRISM
jgi:hypothetical protein